MCLEISANPPTKTAVRSRDLKLFDPNAFRSAIEASILHSDFFHRCDLPADYPFDTYNHTLSSFLDIHAPWTERVFHQRRSAPWFNREILLAKRKRRSLELRWRRSRSADDREKFTQQRNIVTQLINRTRRDYNN